MANVSEYSVGSGWLVKNPDGAVLTWGPIGYAHSVTFSFLTAVPDYYSPADPEMEKAGSFVGFNSVMQSEALTATKGVRDICILNR